MYKDIEEAVATCPYCLTQRPNQRKKPLMPTPLPDRPWQCVGVDICELEGRYFLIMVDYSSCYIDIAQLSTMTSSQVIGKLKNIFTRWGIPEELVTDNGTQFSSDEIRVFATNYGFTHMSSSSHFPQSNEEVERAVETAKRILRQDDPFIALMAYRSTPTMPTVVSPCQLLMGRQINRRLPHSRETYSHSGLISPKSALRMRRQKLLTAATTTATTGLNSCPNLR